MKKICLLLFLMVLILSGFVFPEKIALLDELTNPGAIVIEKNQVFITKGASVFIYSFEAGDVSLHKKFGKAGEGPGEFIVIPTINRGCVTIDVQPGYILISSMGKVSLFSRDGYLLKEARVNTIMGWYTGMENGFAGLEAAQDNSGSYLKLYLYDSDFKEKKELFKIKIWKQGKKFNPIMASRFPLVYTDDDKIFIDGYINEGSGKIHVFEKTGEKSHSIVPEFERLIVTGDDKKNVLNWYKTNPRIREAYDFLKNLFLFPDYFPEIRWYTISDQKIYILTYKKEDGKSEFLVFDISGKFLKKVFLPLVELDDIQFYPFTICQKALYQLVENENEAWELHRTGI
ncbi:hypothetical protein ACFLRB_03930 [Acidobacteriota bacterium]